jgi:hypothetical protein
MNWVDIACLGLVSVVAAVQFLRATRDFSRVLYEAIFLVGAAVLATKLLKPAHALTHVSYPVCFLGVFIIAAALGMVLAVLLNARLAFGFGIFSYLFGLLLGLVCAYAVGHVAIRTPYIAFAHLNPAFHAAVQRSWMARDLLQFRTFIEILALLRNARWLHV